MTEKEKLIEKNNELREQLTPENKKYYENVLIYLRTKSLFHDELAIENILMELLQDILEAQKNNESAESYFGKKPQEQLDIMLKQLPRIPVKKKLSLVFIVFVISTTFSLFSTLANPVPSINLLSILFNGVISVLFVSLIFYLINRYTFKPDKNKKKEFLIVFLVGFTFFTLTFLSNYFGGLWLSIHVPKMTSLIIIWLAVIIISGWIILKKKKDSYYFIPSMIMLALVPTLFKLPMTKHLFLSSTNKIIFAVITLIIVYGSMYLGTKKLKD